MIAVIQAGGRGTRVAELTRDAIPKPLIPIGGIPILHRQLDTLAAEGIRDFIVITGHLSEAIERSISDRGRGGIRVRCYRETAPLGSGGALPMLADQLGNEDFLFVNGDLIFDFDISRMVGFHRKTCASVTLFAHPNTHPHDSDVLVTETDGRVAWMAFKNAPREGWLANLVNAGMAMITPRVLQGIPQGKKLNFEHDIVAKLIEDGTSVYAYRSPEYVRDVGTSDRIRQADLDIRRGLVTAKNLRYPQKAVFLDRDGTINKSAGLIYEEERFALIDGAAEAIKAINDSGYLALCVTNQSVVARGLCDEEGVRLIHRKMETLLGQSGAYLDDIAYCPHHPDKGYPEERPAYKIRCACRKPGIGMITDFAQRYHIDLAQSWIIGDAESDILCGKNAGLRTCLIGPAACSIEPDAQCADLLEAYTGKLPFLSRV